MRCERADAGMARQFFFFFLSNWDGAPPRVGALRKQRTLRIGSGGTERNSLLTVLT